MSSCTPTPRKGRTCGTRSTGTSPTRVRPRWEPRGNEAIQPGSTGFEDDLAEITRGRPDALFLNLFGIDAINALTAAQDAVPEETQIVVPFIDDSLGYIVGSDVADVLGTMPWEAGLEGEYADAYDSAYVSSYGTIAGGDAATGSGTAHVTYTQTLQVRRCRRRARRIVRSGAIQSALEGHEYDTGGGDQRLQACNPPGQPCCPGRSRQVQSRPGGNFELLDHRDGVVPTCEEEPANVLLAVAPQPTFSTIECPASDGDRTRRWRRGTAAGEPPGDVTQS